jgi:hypothetical protein
MATQSVKVKNDDSQSGIGAGASKIGGQVSGTIQDTREFLRGRCDRCILWSFSCGSRLAGAARRHVRI